MKSNSSEAARIILILLVFVLSESNCFAQQEANCRDSLNKISQAYYGGEWSKVNLIASNFIKSFKLNEDNFFSSKTSYSNVYSSDCNTFLPQAYYYLIKSNYRLHELDSVDAVYKTTLKQGLEVRFDSSDNNLRQYLQKFRIKTYSLGLYANSIYMRGNWFYDSYDKGHKRYDGSSYQIGIQYAPTKSLNYINLSFRNTFFYHDAFYYIGTFGYSLRRSSGYTFIIQGQEKFIDLSYFTRIPIASFKKTFLCLTTGASVNYYLNSFVKYYHIVKLNDVLSDDDVIYRSTPEFASENGRFVRIDALNMDLKKLYAHRFGGEIHTGFGIGHRLPNKLTLFSEARYTIGTNYEYDYNLYKNYRPGVNYFSIMLGVTKTFNTIKIN